MKKIYLLVTICVLVVSACSKDNKVPEPEQPEISKLGCISGKIIIFNTGAAIDAYVELLSKEKEFISRESIDQNGDYTIDRIPEGIYFFRVRKQGFIDTLFKNAIKIEPKILNNGCRTMDWVISKLPSHLYVVEVNTEKIIDTLDFGNFEDRFHFQIYNNSESTYIWGSDFEDVKSTKKWLKSMTYSSGTLAPNEAKNITITIDRSMLNVGQNTANILIDSDKGGGWVLSVKAGA